MCAYLLCGTGDFRFSLRKGLGTFESHDKTKQISRAEEFFFGLNNGVGWRGGLNKHVYM